MNALAGRVVAVAGATGGMGRATAIAAAAEGASIVAIGRNREALDDVVAQITASGGVALAAAGQVDDVDAMSDVIRAAADRFGRLDALVNSVGGNISDRALTVLTPSGWREVLAANLDVAFALTQAVLPVFREQQDGLLLHIASSAAKKPDQSGAAYQAAKSGVVGLAHATMEEERANGVRVSVVFPGLTDTPLVAKRPVPVPADVLAKALQSEDVAHLCVTLLALPARAHVPEVTLYPARV